MAKAKPDFNTIYISERLQESLRSISFCAMTTLTAPMGYGKTTAVNWYLSEHARSSDVLIIRISVYSDNLAIFWKSVQDAFAHAGLDFLSDCPCPADDAGGSLLADELCHRLSGERPCFIFIDDFHLLTDGRAAEFLCILAGRMPENVHVIVASRDRFIPGREILRLGGRLCQIGVEQLRLNHTELSVYARRCRISLSNSQISDLLVSSEGWFSAVYLNLRTLSERGALPDRTSDIYAMFYDAMIAPLPAEHQEFLAVMGLADEFTCEMAEFITESSDTHAILSSLTEQNAFVRLLTDGITYRFHHMMKECSDSAFKALSEDRQEKYLNRYGLWYGEHSQYVHAMSAYAKCGNFDGFLDIVRRDAGILLSSLSPDKILKIIDDCPVQVLKAHPAALLVLMRTMFNWHRIPKMLSLKEIFNSALDENRGIPEDERGNLLGECDLIMSFLMYNDISAMSSLHRSASSLMSRPAISIRSSGGWTFGSPSVLMMFHRAPGALSAELADMDACMPHYYRITNGHGQGAEQIMRAEADFYRGHFEDAQIALERAYAQIDGNGQDNMALCCDFLAMRMAVCSDVKLKYSLSQRREYLLERHNFTWINIWNSACAYYFAVLGKPDRIPPQFAQHELSRANFLAPGKPMMDMIENQVYLAQGEYAKVIGRSAGLISVCERMHYGLVALHLKIQTAAAFEGLGRHSDAYAILSEALSLAEPDSLIMPFAESYRCLSGLFTRGFPDTDGRFLESVIRHGAEYDARRQALLSDARPDALACLTRRELDIAMLMSERLTNREIGEKLFLSEGSVKQYINQIYSKLSIDGDTRTKRQRLLGLINAKS